VRRAVPAVVAVAALAGCAPGANDELKALVEEVVPANRETAECDWSFGTGPDRYGCIYFVHGSFAQAKRAVLARLEARQFVSTCRVVGNRFKITAARDDALVLADVVRGTLVLPRNVNDSDEGYEIRAGEVAVDIRADEGGRRAARGARCDV
jgi:hypothetical protein